MSPKTHVHHYSSSDPSTPAVRFLHPHPPATPLSFDPEQRPRHLFLDNNESTMTTMETTTAQSQPSSHTLPPPPPPTVAQPPSASIEFTTGFRHTENTTTWSTSSPRRTSPAGQHRKTSSWSSNYGSVSSTHVGHPFPQSPSPPPPTLLLIKTPGSSCWQDGWQAVPGSLPHSLWVTTVIGVACGWACWAYYTLLQLTLQVLWKPSENQDGSLGPSLSTWWMKMMMATATDSSGNELNESNPSWAWCYIPLVTLTLAVVGVGGTVQFVGDPGDLASTIDQVHRYGTVSLDHAGPMALASLASIAAGASLGPEAPLVGLCAALAGWISRQFFHTQYETGRHDHRPLLRKHTLCGMAGALSAFFGCPLGGSLFALEVHSRFGMEYFEHAVEAIFCGQVCLTVFRATAGLDMAPIWRISSVPLPPAPPAYILMGAFIGVLGAAVSMTFAWVHRNVVMVAFRRAGLLEKRSRAIPRALLGGCLVALLGLLVPHTMFWGELEFQTVSTLSPANTLPHVWPTAGLFHFEMNSLGTSLLVGVAKLLAISVSVAGGFRGGYIFPAFLAGAPMGRALHFVCPWIPVQLCVLCMAGAMNVALTRTALATTLILSFLSGEQNALSAILAASLVSLFVTAYHPFIPTQRPRADLEYSMFTTPMWKVSSVGPNDGDGEPISGQDHHDGEQGFEDISDWSSEATYLQTPLSEVHKTAMNSIREEENGEESVETSRLVSFAC